MEWAAVADDLTWDGSWRDICVPETSIEDWNKLIIALIASHYSTQFVMDGEARPLPSNIGELRLAFEKLCWAQIDLGGIVLNCHFFDEGEIELDFDPRTVKGAPELEMLKQFIIWMAKVLDKEALLTHENVPDAIIWKYDPHIFENAK